MSRGTIYTIYKSMSNDKIEFDKELLIKNYNIYRANEYGYDESNGLKYNWENIPDVIDENMALSKDYKNEIEDDFDNVKNCLLKEDGTKISKIASWSFCSNSLFMLDEIFDLGNYPDETIISDNIVQKYIDAMNFALDYNPKKNGKNSQAIVNLLNSNSIFRTIVSNNYAPFPSVTGKFNEEYDESEFVLMSVKSIFETYKTLKESDDSQKSKYILTIEYYG